MTREESWNKRLWRKEPVGVVSQSLRREGTGGRVEAGTLMSCTYLLCGESTDVSSSTPKVCRRKGREWFLNSDMVNGMKIVV